MEWYILQDSENKGPYSWEEMRNMVENGEIGPDDMVWTESMSEWTKAAKVDGLIASLPDAEQLPVSSSGITVRTAKKTSAFKVIAIIVGCLILFVATGVVAYSLLTSSKPDSDKVEGDFPRVFENGEFDDPFDWSDERLPKPGNPLPGDPSPGDPLPGAPSPSDPNDDILPPAQTNPVARISIVPNRPMVDETVSFIGANSYSREASGSITNYSWEIIENGARGSGAIYEKTFSSTGLYTVVLTVADENGNTGVTTSWVRVFPASDEPAPPDDETTPPDDEVAPPNDETTTPDDETDPSGNGSITIPGIPGFFDELRIDLIPRVSEDDDEYWEEHVPVGDDPFQ